MFRRKAKELAPIFQKLHHRSILSIGQRDNTNFTERTLGREGKINISDGEMVIICQNAEVFRKPLHSIEVAEFMSHDGFTVRDLSDPDAGLYTVYYTK